MTCHLKMMTTTLQNGIKGRTRELRQSCSSKTRGTRHWKGQAMKKVTIQKAMMRVVTIQSPIQQFPHTPRGGNTVASQNTRACSHVANTERRKVGRKSKQRLSSTRVARAETAARQQNEAYQSEFKELKIEGKELTTTTHKVHVAVVITSKRKRKC